MIAPLRLFAWGSALSLLAWLIGPRLEVPLLTFINGLLRGVGVPARLTWLGDSLPFAAALQTALTLSTRASWTRRRRALLLSLPLQTTAAILVSLVGVGLSLSSFVPPSLARQLHHDLTAASTWVLPPLLWWSTLGRTERPMAHSQSSKSQRHRLSRSGRRRHGAFEKLDHKIRDA